MPSPDILLQLYEKMVLLRRFELAAQALYKKGETPGFIHLYIGEEAVATGVCAHLRNDDWITSTHRGHGHALAKGLAPRKLMAELYGKATGCCGGRGGSMHLYDREHGVFGTNGIVGGGIPHAVGAALSARARGSDGIGVAFFGDGAVNHGAFHESLNFAAAQNAGVVFVCENNLYATATPLAVATRNRDIASKAAAYGIPGIAVDGNDVLAVHEAAAEAVRRARSGLGPTLIEAKTYRTVGHNEGEPLTGTYRTQDELDLWTKRCPVAGFRRRLIEEFHLQAEALDGLEQRVDAIVDEAIAFARQSPPCDPATRGDHAWSDGLARSADSRAELPESSVREQSWLEAVRDGIAEEMRADRAILYFGEGIGERGGSFGHTKGLWQEFGGGRVIDTPISELGFTGAAIGASATGCRSIADLMFVDFLFESGGQIPLQASKLRYMSNGQLAAPLVVRAPCGAIKSAGPQHSGTYHSMWSHLPGIVVAMPSNPADAKGLMKTALHSRDPVLFLEPKALFSMRGPVPTGDHRVPFGVAKIIRAGRDLTIVTAGRMVQLVMQAADELLRQDISCEVIDLRTIVPLDLATITGSLGKTGRLLTVDEGYSMCGIGAEITAAVVETAFDLLDAPIGRLHMDPVPHPFSPVLEAAVLPSVEKIVFTAAEIIRGRAQAQIRPVVRRESNDEKQQAVPSTITTRDPVQPVKVAVPRAGRHAITMPHGDLTVSEAKVVAWLKRAGDKIIKGEVVAEVETDKAVLQVEAEDSGFLAQISVSVGATVKMGGVLGYID